LERATQQDPQFAQAWAGLAEICEIAIDLDQKHAAEMKSRATTSARRALKLDDTLAEAHTILGTLQFFHEWDFVGAEASWRRAVELNPRVIESLRQYVDLLRLSGRYDESTAILSYAEVLAPNAPEIAIERALLLYSRRQYDKALESAQRATALRANYRQGLWMQGLCLERLGRWREAEQKYRSALALSANDSRAVPALGYLLAKTGRTAEAQSILQTLTMQNSGGPIRGYSIALVHAGLGDVPRALDALEMGFKQHDSSMPYLKVEQRFETLASHPRFRALVARMNLPGPAVN
jgi:Flp pilus assembly protein TadD